MYWHGRAIAQLQILLKLDRLTLIIVAYSEHFPKGKNLSLMQG